MYKKMYNNGIQIQDNRAEIIIMGSKKKKKNNVQENV